MLDQHCWFLHPNAHAAIGFGHKINKQTKPFPSHRYGHGRMWGSCINGRWYTYIKLLYFLLHVRLEMCYTASILADCNIWKYSNLETWHEPQNIKTTWVDTSALISISWFHTKFNNSKVNRMTRAIYEYEFRL